MKLKVEDGVIVDGSFVGEGCAVSQASADMMLDLIIGQKVEDAEKLADNFLKMIKGTATEEEIESLEEASALEDIAHMPARVKCAVTALPMSAALITFKHLFHGCLLYTSRCV